MTIYGGNPRIVSMRGDLETRWISIRLADSEHYTVFKCGGWNSRQLLLTPASKNQNKVDIEFYYHASDASKPLLLGTIKFEKLPAGEVELALEAKLTPEGILSAAVRHSGRTENLKVPIPDIGVQRLPAKQGLLVRSGMRWFLGILYAAIALTIAFWLVRMVTDWGENDLPPPPISRSAIELPIA